MRPDVLIIGLGGVGSWALELLARANGISYLVGADVDQEWGRQKVFNVAAGATLQEYYPRLEFIASLLKRLFCHLALGDVAHHPPKSRWFAMWIVY